MRAQVASAEIVSSIFRSHVWLLVSGYWSVATGQWLLVSAGLKIRIVFTAHFFFSKNFFRLVLQKSKIFLSANSADLFFLFFFLAISLNFLKLTFSLFHCTFSDFSLHIFHFSLHKLVMTARYFMV